MSFVTPGYCNDMHGVANLTFPADCQKKTQALITRSDSWLASHVEAWRAAGAIVIVTFDEGSTKQGTGGHVYTVAVGPGHRALGRRHHVQPLLPARGPRRSLRGGPPAQRRGSPAHADRLRSIPPGRAGGPFPILARVPGPGRVGERPRSPKQEVPCSACLPRRADRSMSSSSSSDTTALWVILGISLVALVFAYYLVRAVLAAPEGTDKMKEIAKAIQEGATAYLSRQFRTLSVFVVDHRRRAVLRPAGARGRGALRLLDPVRPVDRVHPGCRVLGDHRVRGHVARGASQRPHRQRRSRVGAAPGREDSRSAPAAWPACSRWAWACSAPPRS